VFDAHQDFVTKNLVVAGGLLLRLCLILWWLKSSLDPTTLSMTAIVHDLAMLALTLLLVGHVFFTYVYKAWSSMATGYVPKTEMVLEHPKWVEEIEHEGAPASAKRVAVTYVQNGRARRVWAGACVMAGYNVMLPYLCPELPAEQRESLSELVRCPLVYTSVLVCLEHCL